MATREELLISESISAPAAVNPALQPPAGMMQGADPDMDAATAWAAETLSVINPKTGKVKGESIVKGWGKMTPQQQTSALPSLWANQPESVKNRFRATSQGKAPGQTGVPQLPEAFRNMPNAPNLSGPAAQVDPMTGRLTKAGASPGAAAAYQGMAEQQETRKATAKAAVAATQAAQVANVAGVVDRSRAARANEQAKSGIVDMGGGNMTLNNKYGSGFVTTGNAPRALGSKPGAVRDENGEVDMKKSVAGGTIVNTLGDPEALPTRKETMGTIAQGQAALAPGAADRLAADRNRQVAKTQATVDANMGKPAAPGAPALPPALQSLPSMQTMPALAAPSAGVSTASRVMGESPMTQTTMPPVRNIMPPPPVAAAPATPAKPAVAVAVPPPPQAGIAPAPAPAAPALAQVSTAVHPPVIGNPPKQGWVGLAKDNFNQSYAGEIVQMTKGKVASTAGAISSAVKSGYAKAGRAQNAVVKAALPVVQPVINQAKANLAASDLGKYLNRP